MQCIRPLTLAITLPVLLFIGTASAAAQTGAGRVHGVVADESGGVTPGVTVVAASEGHVLATGVTDQVGRYAFSGLPATAVRLTFQLEGFSTAVLDITIAPGADLALATPRLRLAPTSETVLVRGTAPVAAAPPAPAVVRPPPPPRPTIKPVPEHDRDSICGPAKADVNPESFGTIRAPRAATGNDLYAEGDELIIDGGKATGLEIGENLVARRSYRTSGDPDGATGEHTAGLLQIVAADAQASVAVVVYACDELMRGDRLAAFKPEPIRTPEPAGMPAYDRAARILLTDAGQLVGAPRRLMVVDQGSDNGIRVGQRLTLFRPPRPGARRPSVLGDAVVVAVRPDSATIRVQRAAEPIALGDSAAPQRP